MKAAVATAVVCLCTVMLSAQHHEAEPQPAIQNIRLRASVQAMAALADFSGEVTPVDFDPRFTLTLRIESAVPAVPNLATALSSLSVSTVQCSFLPGNRKRARPTISRCAEAL
jgi:hypothetical protein